MTDAKTHHIRWWLYSEPQQRSWGPYGASFEAWEYYLGRCPRIGEVENITYISVLLDGPWEDKETHKLQALEFTWLKQYLAQRWDSQDDAADRIKEVTIELDDWLEERLGGAVSRALARIGKGIKH
jgi:hypothetical protein